ncbi:MAG: hypothetical protein WBV39_10285, partial [Rudaea sp.]
MSSSVLKSRMNKLAAGLCAALALSGAATSAIAGGHLGGVRLPPHGISSVTSCADDNSVGTLRQIIANAASGDQVDMSGLGCSTITLTQGEILIPHNIYLVGPANATLTITGDGSDRVLQSISADTPSAFLSISNLTIAGGRIDTTGDGAVGGCILSSGDVILSNSTVTDCVAHSSASYAFGGGIYAPSVSIQSSRVTDSSAYADSAMEMARGGGIYAGGLACTDSTLSSNQSGAVPNGASGQGGGAFVSGGNVSLSRCTVDSNQADEAGGIAQFVGSYTATTTIQNSTISGNSAAAMIGGFELFCSKCSPAPMQLLNSTVAFNSALQ